MAQEITLTLTVNERKSPFHRFETGSIASDEGYGSSSPNSAIMNLPMTVSENIRSASPSSGERFKFRLPWGASSADNGSDKMKRLENEKDAEEFISSLSGRSLTIQRIMVAKILNKEKRKVKFGLSSSKLMDLAIRRYSYKLSELERDIQLEREFPKCPEEFGFVLRHYAERLKLPTECQKFRKMYWDCHGRHLDLSRVMFNDTNDMARKRQLVLERIPRKKLHPENSHSWWAEDIEGNIIPSRDHVEWICWGYTPDVEEVLRICNRIAKLQPPDTETVRLYRAQAVLSS